MGIGTRRGIASITAALVILAVMATSFLAGENISHGSSQDYVIAGTPVPSELKQPLDDLWQVYQHLNSDSYWRPFDGKQLLYDATSGMVDGSSPLQDPHSLFFPPAASQQVTSQLNNGGAYGIGADVQMVKAGLEITAPLVDSPAEKAGLRQGDLIIAVDGKDIRHMSADQAVALIHGNQGTVVALTIVRSGTAQPFVVRVTRDSIPDVRATHAGEIGLIQFTVFGEHTATEVHDALAGLMATDHLKGVIIDLRDNVGGYVSTAKAIAGEFLPAGSVLFWERTNLGNGHYSDASTTITTTGIAQHLPVVVLVNGGTASAAEIFTEALREHGRAKALGTRTYGKDSEQEVLNLPDGASIRITTHRWLTPQKNSISGGFLPDFVVPQTAGGPDSQLLRAIQYLQTGK